MNSKTCSRWLESLLIFHGQGMLHDVDRRKSITASMNSFPWQRKNELIQLSFNLPHVDINTMARSNMVVPSLGWNSTYLRPEKKKKTWKLEAKIGTICVTFIDPCHFCIPRSEPKHLPPNVQAPWPTVCRLSLMDCVLRTWLGVVLRSNVTRVCVYIYICV